MTPLVTNGIIYRPLTSAFVANVIQGLACEGEPFLFRLRWEGRPFLHRPATDDIWNGDTGLDQRGYALGRQLDDKGVPDAHGEDPAAHAERVRIHALRPSGIRGFGHRADTEGLRQRLERICHAEIIDEAYPTL